MKVAIIGSRQLEIENLSEYIPLTTTEIVSGGAKGIDTCAKKYAISANIKLTEFLSDYSKYGKSAPLYRNLKIIAYADEIIAFWDGKSHGTKFVIDNALKQNKKAAIIICK